MALGQKAGMFFLRATQNIKSPREFLSLLRKHAGALHKNIANNTEMSEHREKLLASFTAKEHRKCACAILTSVKKVDVPFPLKAMDFIFFGYTHKIKILPMTKTLMQERLKIASRTLSYL